MMLDLSARFLALAEKHETTIPVLVGHCLTGMSLMHTGELIAGREHLDRALKMYAPSEHRSLADRFGQDVRTAVLSYRALAVWILGYPDAALADADEAVEKARELVRRLP